MNDRGALAKAKTRIHLIIGLGISIAVVLLFYEKMSYADILDRLVNVELGWVFFALLINIVILSVFTLRWRVILSPVKETDFVNLLSASSIALLGNNFLPARMGELLRIFVLSKRENMSKSTIAASIFVEKIGMSLSLLIVIACTYPFLLLHDSHIAGKNIRHLFENGLIVFSLVNLVVVIGILLFPKYKSWGRDLLVGIFSGLPSKWYEKGRAAVLMFAEGLDIRRKRDIGNIAFLSVIHWCLFGLRVFFIVKAFQVHITLMECFVVMFCVVVAISVSNVPGHIGIYHVGGIVGLVLIDIEINTAISIAVLLHAVPFVFNSFVGLLFMWRENLSVLHLADTGRSIRLRNESC